MREILFRGKRTDNGEWVYGCVLQADNWSDISVIYNYDGSMYEPPLFDFDSYEVIPSSIGQYTGLTDKNGKRIFEGDIVKADDFIFAVKYGKCGGVANADNYGYMGFYLEPFSEATKLHARYGLRNDICYFDNIEIINNIHDNPELLKGE